MTDLETLFPYQVAGANWLATMPQALLADVMGLGKSCQAIRAADSVGAENILVICPAAVCINWTREFEKFSPMDRPCHVVSGRKDVIPKGGVGICSYNLTVDHAHTFRARRWDALILDEAHYLKDRNAKRTKAIYGHGSNRPGIVASCARVWRLTGTPAPNWADELWTHLKSAGLTTDPYWDFVFRYCSGFEGSYGYKITGHKNVEELKRLLSKFMLRRTKEQVMKELPPIFYQTITVGRSDVELDPYFYEQIVGKGEQQFFQDLKVADQTLRHALSAVSDGKQPNEDRAGILESMGASLVTLRRYIGMAKLPTCVKILEDELKYDPALKLVIFAVHQCVIEETRKALRKFGAVTVYGLTPPAKRQKHIDRFMNDPQCRVFVGNIQAAGTGITLTSSSEVVFLEQDWVPANNAQAAMRVHRIGQTRPVRVRVFSLEKSVDEQVQRTLLLKARELTKLDF